MGGQVSQSEKTMDSLIHSSAVLAQTQGEFESQGQHIQAKFLLLLKSTSTFYLVRAEVQILLRYISSFKHYLMIFIKIFILIEIHHLDKQYQVFDLMNPFNIIWNLWNLRKLKVNIKVFRPVENCYRSTSDASWRTKSWLRSRWSSTWLSCSTSSRSASSSDFGYGDLSTLFFFPSVDYLRNVDLWTVFLIYFVHIKTPWEKSFSEIFTKFNI